MTTPRLFSVLALLTLGACGSPRGGNSITTGESDAAATDSPAVTTDTPARTDTPAVPSDVPVAPVDVPVAIDVPVTPVDVPTVRCGNGACEEGESCTSCRADCLSECPPPPIDVPVNRCGNGACEEGESCTTCRADCLSMCPPPPVDVPTARCGDGTCNGTETCTSCASDCAPCTGAVTDPCGAGVSQGPSRNCGWRPGTTFACSPGRATMVGCSGTAGVGSLCQPSYGVCVGDPVVRVCPGTTPCTAATALVAASGSFDDQCEACPSAYVTCPASGQIFVLTGDYDSNVTAQQGTCTPAVR